MKLDEIYERLQNITPLQSNIETGKLAGVLYQLQMDAAERRVPVTAKPQDNVAYAAAVHQTVLSTDCTFQGLKIALLVPLNKSGDGAVAEFEKWFGELIGATRRIHTAANGFAAAP